jgi:hypothetical protein
MNRFSICQLCFSLKRSRSYSQIQPYYNIVDVRNPDASKEPGDQKSIAVVGLPSEGFRQQAVSLVYDRDTSSMPLPEVQKDTPIITHCGGGELTHLMILLCFFKKMDISHYFVSSLFVFFCNIVFHDRRKRSIGKRVFGMQWFHKRIEWWRT